MMDWLGSAGGALAVPSSGLGAVWGWSGPILLPGNYPGTTRDLGWLRWGARADTMNVKGSQ